MLKEIGDWAKSLAFAIGIVAGVCAMAIGGTRVVVQLMGLGG